MHPFNLNDFQLMDYQPSHINHAPQMTVNADAVIFNASALKKLGFPSSIKLLFDAQGRRVALQGFSKKSSGSIDFNPERKSKDFGIYKQDNVKFIRNLMLEQDEITRFKVCGEYHENENVMVFDLKKASVFNGGQFPSHKRKTQMVG